jgi:starch synthase
MRIVIASSEAVPFAKTGGLADVATALATALTELGHSVWLVLPHYPQAMSRIASSNGIGIEPTGVHIEVPLGARHVSGGVLRAHLPGSAVTVLLIDQAAYYDRPALYQSGGSDFRDNCERFVFLSRAVTTLAQQLRLRPDVIHANDWQTGLIPALLAIEGRSPNTLENCGSVFTIHNMAFQGLFWHWDMLLTGLDWKYFNWHQMEFYNQLSFLKTGIVFSDMVTTVSPTYAREIQTPEFGYGLDNALRSRRDDLVGILNGVDTKIWNSQTDPALPRNFSIADLEEGKRACKQALQKEFGLPQRDEVPLFAMVTRLTAQKGLDLVTQAAERFFAKDLQLCVLGSGEAKYESWFAEAAQKSPKQVAVRIGFDDALAHRIEAGADLFLMPSRFEPCGLNQMYSLIYGTVPVVRSVGGLADSVVDASPQNLAHGTATGFCFTDYSAEALMQTIERAIALFADKVGWMRLVRAGVNQDLSWRTSALQYVRVYERAVAKRRAAVAAPAPNSDVSITV